MRKRAVIVAGGTGSRLGGTPKQFRIVNGKPLIWWSIKAFHEEDPGTEIMLVLHPDYIDIWKELFFSLPSEDQIAHTISLGGASRTDSVYNGILDVPADADYLIAIHDAARPLVTKELIRRGWTSAEKHGASVPAIPVTDSLRYADSKGNHSVDRTHYMAVQTPQVFKGSVLIDAYRRRGDGPFTDDASVTEAAGYGTALFEGDVHNMKVTNPGDIEIASLLLKQYARLP